VPVRVGVETGTPTRIGSTGGGSREWEPLASRVLTARGLMSEGASAFLEPSLRSLHDPSLLPDLDRAAERILEAVASDQTVAVYGDYDVDGVSATAILVRTLRAIAPAARVLTYIPHRIDEGYGLNADAIRSLAGEGARVIVSVDCGITATGPALAAGEAGVDLIITDHHNGAEREEDLPRAFAIVHPRRPGSAYPFGDLCGAGVAYKLAWRLCTMHAGSARLPADLRELLVELLSLAALGVIADVVPLRGENRVLARHGLSRIKASPFIGLRALVKASGLDGERIDTEGVGFSLAPRLNACGRLGHAREALELMLTEDAVRAAEIARELTKLNNERRGVERRIAEEALAMARACGMAGPDRRAVVLAHEDWHAGVVGIVCSRLVERLGRPTILMQRQGELLVGSGRSIEGFSLHGALEACAEHLHGFGGHDMAAGVKVLPERLDAFVEAFVANANAALGPSDLVPRIQFDCDAPAHELTPLAVRQLESLAPFGQGNPPVRVRLTGIRMAGRPEPFGKSGNHLKFQVKDRDRSLRLVAWNWGSRHAETAASIPAGARIDALVVPKLSSWSGLVEPELLDLCAVSESVLV
jgi:single-stranded-DNA-specific exonuclease